MDREIQLFTEFLNRKNLKSTQQREEILKCFLRTERHLSAEDLYDIIKNKNLRIGQSTVFRTLKLLCESGIAKEVDIGDKKIRYEHKYGHEHHDHLVCLECGRLIEVLEPKIEELQEILCKKFKFFPQKHKMEIFGICQRCRKEDKN